MRKKIIMSLVFIVMVIYNSSAQCAMCKAQLESSDGDIGNGLNSGILYLMIIPYILLTVMAIVFFKGRIKSSIRNFLN
jgi:hypothetical protein